jgi:hypothetical protein
MNSCGPRAVHIYKFLRSEALYIVIIKCGMESIVFGVVEQPDISVEA